MPLIHAEEWQAMVAAASRKETLYNEVEASSPDGKLAVRMGRNITSFLNGTVDPMDLMFGQGDDLLDQVYAGFTGLGDLPGYLREYLDNLAHSSANLNILEVSAGTGSGTSIFLESLQPTGGERKSLQRYTFTDVSAGCFEKAREKLKAWRDILDFKVFDIEKEPLPQGIEAQMYDIVVAGEVIHATQELLKTLKNLRRIMKPGGRLIMHEGVRQDFIWSGIAFGQLPGWWLAVETSRKWCPWIPPRQWDVVLEEAGFKDGIEIEVSDRQDPKLRSQSILIAQASHEDDAAIPKLALVTLSVEANDTVQKLRAGLAEMLPKTEISQVHFLELASTDLTSTICVSLLESKRPVLSHLNADEYTNIRQMIATCDGLLWVTGDARSQPELGMITGLLRTVRWERDLDAASFVTLSFSDACGGTDQTEWIQRVFKQQYLRAARYASHQNAEFLVEGDTLLSNRIVPAKSGNDFLTSKFANPQPRMQALGEAGRPLKLRTASPGLLNRLEWATDSNVSIPLEDDEVEIDIQAVGLNFRDLMIAMGEHMANSLGGEAAGTITRVGGNVANLLPGDRVTYLGGHEEVGCFHTYGRANVAVVAKIPDTMSFEIACSLPCVWATVLYGLRDLARLSKGETVLIHAAAGGVGQAAIQYAHLVGRESACHEQIFSSRDLTFVQGVMRVTGKGVDVVLNSLSGEALRRSWECLAPFGRFIEIGKKDAQNHAKIDLSPFLRSVTMASVELSTMMRHIPEVIGKLTSETVQMYAEGKIREAEPTKLMTFGQVEDALRILQSGKGMGKIVLKPDPIEQVAIVPDREPPLQLDQHASYLLAGGLGGLGRSFAKWLVTRGARSLIFLSRGSPSEAAQTAIDGMRHKGCQVHVFKCDVSDRSSLESALKECEGLPLIRGCIQGAMVLDDAMFKNLSYDAWSNAVRPKVQGSWNLSECLLDVDFFVMLSSATGIIGHRSQANYAAGNTYQDALTTYRLSKGLPSSTIDLGNVLSVGYVAENQEKTKIYLGAVLEVLREDEIHAMLEYAIRYGGHFITGLTTAKMYQERGVPLPTYMSYPLFSHLNQTAGAGSMDAPDDPSLVILSQLVEAPSMEAAAKIMSDGLQAKLSVLLNIPVVDAEPNKSISSNGVDSLIATEFRAWLQKTLGVDIPMVDIMGQLEFDSSGRQSGEGELCGKSWEGVKRDALMNGEFRRCSRWWEG